MSHACIDNFHIHNIRCASEGPTMIGQTLGRYLILEKIGAGGMGVVYRARDERLDRDVALKVLTPTALADVIAVRSFRKEAQALSKLNHPNIATVHDFDGQDELSFLIMEYIPGVTLDQKIAAGKLAEKEILRIAMQLVQGLHAAHSEGVIHRDLKPGNLRITPDCRLKILDFGLARLVAPTDKDQTRSSFETRTGAGTLPYMSPERLEGEAADQRSDIYAVGAVLYEMATGQRLFPSKDGPLLIDAILHQVPQLPRQINSQISLGMQAIILKALDKKANRRYQSAMELQLDLERLSQVPSGSQREVSSGPSEALPLEIAHVLFMDIVAYSKLSMDRQRELLEELQKTVRGTVEFTRAKTADTLVSLPSGDGMALVFFGDPEAPCRCALEISQALRKQSGTKLRMGIHTGPVYRVADINANRNVSGGGINIAQRVMDCGDAGHILVSRAVADVLAQVSRWKGSLHELGEAEVKHGVRVHLFNLYTADLGNPKAPRKLLGSTHKSDVHRSTKPRRVGPRQSHRSSPDLSVERKSHPDELRPITEPVPIIASETDKDVISVKPITDPVPAFPPSPLHRRIAPIRKGIFVLGLATAMLGALAIAVPAVRHKVFGSSSSNALVTPTGIPPLAEGKYLAILPFAVRNDSGSFSAVAEGLSQGLSAKLLSVRDLSVASSRAAETVDPRASLVAMGQALGANLIIRGTVRGDGKTIHITVNLHEAASGRRLFSQDYSGVNRNLLVLQDQIYSDLLQNLALNPSGEEMTRAASHPTDNPEAYEFYNNGRNEYRGHPSVDRVKKAIGFYNEALKRDSNFALAYASLADASLTMYRDTQDSMWIRKATEAAQQSQRLDDNLIEAHLSLGNVYRETGKTDEAIKELRRALQLSPKCDACYRRVGGVYLDAGMKDQALRAFQNAITLNPYFWSNYNELGSAYLQFGENKKALDAFRRVVELDPTNPLGHQNVGAVYFSQGKYEESILEFKDAIALQPEADVYTDLGEALLYLKRYPEALELLKKAAEMHPNNEIVLGNLADGFRYSGQDKKAMNAYDLAITRATKDLEVNPKNAAALGNLGLYYAKKGDTSLAAHCIRRARAIDPSDVQLAYNEAIIYALSNQPDLAIASLRNALQSGNVAEQAALEPEFTSLRNNPSFKKLVSEFLEKSKKD
jgi:serine/threonine protein kinase/tetratricopeptide (TPR) repeat protein